MKYLIVILSLFFCLQTKAQIIFPENFAVLLDSTKTFKGAFSPEVKIQTQKDLLVQLNSVTDLAFRIRNNSLSIAQKFEFTSVGGNRALSGGYLYSKFKTNKNKQWIPEYFAQIQWEDSRGLLLKFAAGANLRYAFFRDAKRGLFMGVGSFYEYEKWNFNGVPDNQVPPGTPPIFAKNLRFNYYVSYKKWIMDKFFLDASIYYQARFDRLVSAPRLASSTGITWQISKHLQLGTEYQNIYDAQPVVPVRKWFHRFRTAFSVNF